MIWIQWKAHANLTVYFWHSNSLNNCLMQNLWIFRPDFKEIYSLQIHAERKNRDENLPIYISTLVGTEWAFSNQHKSVHGQKNLHSNRHAQGHAFTFLLSCPIFCLFSFLYFRLKAGIFSISIFSSLSVCSTYASKYFSRI